MADEQVDRKQKLRSWSPSRSIFTLALLTIGPLAAFAFLTRPHNHGQPSAIIVDSGLTPSRFTVAVFGDSTAGSLAWTLRGVQKPGVTIVHLSKDGCTMLYDGCGGEQWLLRIRENQPDAVVLFVGGAFEHELEATNGRWVSACHPEWDAKFESVVSMRLADLIAPLPNDSDSSLAPPPRKVFALTVPYVLGDFGGAEFQDQITCINKSLRRAVNNVPGVEMIDLNEHICPGGRCIVYEPGLTIPIRPDGVHFHMDGARPMSSWVLEEIAK